MDSRSGILAFGDIGGGSPAHVGSLLFSYILSLQFLSFIDDRIAYSRALRAIRHFWRSFPMDFGHNNWQASPGGSRSP